MKNVKLIALMNLKGMTQATLSKETHIPASTLKRIINGENQKDKMVHMESISRALGTSVHSIFDIPLETPLAAAAVISMRKAWRRRNKQKQRAQTLKS